MKNPKESVCERANRLVSGVRQWDYDHPKDNMSRIAKMWEVILGVDNISPKNVALCMIAVKISRETHSHNKDNLVDIAGYAQVADLTIENVIHKDDEPTYAEKADNWLAFKEQGGIRSQYDPHMRYCDEE